MKDAVKSVLQLGAVIMTMVYILIKPADVEAVCGTYKIVPSTNEYGCADENDNPIDPYALCVQTRWTTCCSMEDECGSPMCGTIQDLEYSGEEDVCKIGDHVFSDDAYFNCGEGQCCLNKEDCETVSPEEPSPQPAPFPTPDYPPPGTQCSQYQFTNEPHPLRPAPALVCQDQVPQPFNLSCANDVIPQFTVSRPRTTANPGDSLNANTTCSKSGCRWDCHRDETLTEAIIGPVNITIDLTDLELPIAGIASRNCDTGDCDVDRLNPATGNPTLSDSFLMRNYTSWYLQGAIEQTDQIPPDLQPKFLDRALTYAGPLKKLIPPEVLNGLPDQDLVGQREELIKEAAAGRTYNQIVGYVNGNQVISRIEAKQNGLTGPGHAIRLTDMKDHINPPYNPDDPEAMKWYTLWHQVPFASSGHIDTAGEFFPTACLRSSEDNRRCQTDPKVLDAKLKVTSGLDSFRVYFPHLVEDDTLLAKLLQNALISQAVPRTDSIPTYTKLSQNLTNPDRLPEWTVSDDGSYRNASGCRIDNPLSNPGDSLEAKRNKKQGIVTAQLQFKRQVSYDYQVSDTCDLNPITGGVPVPVSAPVPVHIRYSHMDEIADRTVVGPGSIFKALYPDIPTTVASEIPPRPAESGLRYSCTAAGGCQAASTSRKSSPSAFFPWWGTTLEFFHQKIQCMLDPLNNCGSQISPTGTAQCVDSIQGKYADDLIRQIIVPSAAKITAMIEYINQQISSGNQTWVGSEFEARYQDVINFGVTNNLNPTFLLALWLEESHAGAVGDYPLGCDAATTLDDSLTCIAEDDAIDLYRDAPLPEFLCMYSDGHYPCTCQANPNFVPNLFSFYDDLI